MKKAISILGYVLFLFIILLPLGIVVSDCFGYTFKLTSYSAFAVMIALLSVGIVTLCLLSKKPIENRATEILLALMAPFSLINTVVYLFECGTILVAICMFFSVCSCGYLTAKYGKPLALKIPALVLSVLLIFPVLFYGAVAVLFDDFGQNTVVKSVESPNGVYYAEVIDSDQGALGGDTFVNVYENTEIDIFIFKISKEPQRIYSGAWGEFKDMAIYWKDDRCLVINSVEYMIE